MNAILDGKSITTPAQFHDAISKALAFPAYYGRNLDALWDCLTGWIGFPTTVIWKDFAVSKAKLGAFGDGVVRVLLRAAEQMKGFEVRFE